MAAQPPTTAVADVPAAAMLEGESVTLIPLDELNGRAQAIEDEANGLSAAANVALENSHAHFAEAGRMLVEHKNEWDSTSVAALLDRATALSDQIAKDHQRLAEDRADTGQVVSNLWKRIRTLKERGHLSAAEAAASSALSGVLVEIAEAPTAAELPDAKSLREAGAAAYAQSTSLAEAGKAKAAELAKLTEEVGRRQDAMASMGFDSLYTAAWLQTHGPAPIQTGLVLKRGEQAFVQTAATLARHGTKMEWVGGSQGFSFPIAHTGIRYRVGSYRGHPVQHEVLNRIDSGELVLTNLRLAFMGKLKLVSVPLDKIANLDTYSDGVAVFQENRENPNIFLVQRVNFVVFYLNYLIGQRS
jgi:hypothetical protein